MCLCMCTESSGKTVQPNFTKLSKHSFIKVYYCAFEFEQLGFHDDVMAAILLKKTVAFCDFECLRRAIWQNYTTKFNEFYLNIVNCI